MKKKVLFILPGFNFGGTVFSTYNMISLLDGDYDIDVLAMTHQGPVKENYTKSKISVLPEFFVLAALSGKSAGERLFRRIGFSLIKGIRRFCKYINIDFAMFVYRQVANSIQKCSQYDYVVSCQELEATYLASCFSKSKRIAWFRSEMSILVNEVSTHEIEKLKDNYNLFDKIICVSKTTCDDFSHHIPEVSDRLLAIHNIQNIEDIEHKANDAAPDIPSDTDVIVTVGRMNPQKRFSAIPKIAHELVRRGCHFKWLLIGDGNVFGEYDNTISEIKKNHVEDCVLCIGSRINPYPYIKRAKLLVSTSYVEACPRVIAEAKILKTPVVCTDFSSAREFVTDGYDGYVDTIDNIVEPIYQMMTNQSRYTQIKKVCEYYSLDNNKIYGQLRNLFE